MILETYRWEPNREPQRCQHEDCFSCPYPDCIATARRIQKGMDHVKQAMKLVEGEV